ncbi:MAG: DUF3179 domain-containing protein [Armatimonadetes bacterium]|nr:DUF3179 domain-containing protein [Armatimonadota bacterium]
MLDGKELTIGVSGMLWKNSLVMYDRETETLWSHFTGEGLAGPNKGKTLKMLRSTPRVKWPDWVAAYPDTKVLKVDGMTHKVVSRYAGYFRDPSKFGMRPVENSDKRLRGKALVLGVLVGDTRTAISFDLLAEEVIVEANVGGQRIAVYMDSETRLFGAVELPDGVEVTDVSERRITTSDGKSYSAADGQGDGDSLTMLPAIRTFWFAWSDHHPETELITGR